MAIPTPDHGISCPRCGYPMPPGAIVCKQCHSIVRRASVEPAPIVFAAEADLPAPQGPRPADEPKRPIPKALAGLGALGLLIWKLKGILLLVLSKAKLILFGLTKWKTLLSMFVSIGLYGAMWGWPFALGFVLSIYIHEMGHVSALRYYGVPASAPMFIPFVGAFVRMDAHPRTAIEDARIGLAGPVWGWVAAIACLLVFHATGLAIFAALAHVGAWLNLFNMMPFWQLDGGRAFAPFTRRHAAIATASLLALLYVTSDGIVLLMVLAAAYRTYKAPKEGDGDLRGVLYYVALVATLGWIFLLEVPGVPIR
jgi:Zn-dependent protease